MKLGELGSVVADLRARLVHFTTHDVRRRPILALYFVIGAMVASYVVYLVVIIAKDLSSPAREQVPTKTAMEQVQEAPVQEAPVQEAPGPMGPGGGEATTQPTGEGGPPQTQETPTQGTASPAEGGARQQTAKSSPEGGERRDWRVYEFPDRCQISFPGTWQESKVPAEKGVIHGIRLEVPGADASIQVYARRREAGEDLVKTLRATMSQKGAHNIDEKRKRIQDLNAVELTGTVADKQMAITIFDHDTESYVVATLIANIKDYPQQRADYDAVLGSYATPQQREQREGISLRDLEQSIQKGLQKTDESLVGKMVELTLANRSTHKGVVVAEDESSYTLENYRFGGRYSFKVKKKDVVKISR
jgi:hypothetical protein